MNQSSLLYSPNLLLNKIAQDLILTGISITENALPTPLCESLVQHLQFINHQQFKDAGIGRGNNYVQEKTIRKDQICWITGESDAEIAWLDWAGELQLYINQHLFLGLTVFESHFAHYRIGDSYVRHSDAFIGQKGRRLTLVVYLNHDWNSKDNGELVIYMDDQDQEGVRVLPKMGTVVVFLSEEFSHEVLPTHRDRYSIAGWFA